MSRLMLLCAYLKHGEITVSDLTDDELEMIVDTFDDGLDVRSLSDEELIAIMEGSDD